MKTTIQILLAVSSTAFLGQAAAQVTFYEHDNFQGRSHTAQSEVRNAERAGFQDRASSVIVVGQRWEACDDARFRGRCVVLRPGQYPSLGAMGMNDRISSARPLAANFRVADSAYAPMPVVARDFRRRGSERLHEAEVSSARAVLGTPAQRCWVTREQVVQQQPSSGMNVPGAAVGAIIGGILGHQVGGGSGKQIATVGGAVGGAALGAQYGRTSDGQQVAGTQDVRRCDNNPAQATPAYWDVVYHFRGQEHRVQMAADPGRTVRVNSRGEPRA
jgi:uncharacterized protein YcfJ